MARVLVADDDEAIRLTLQFLLEDEGFEVLLASDGEKAFGLALAERPEVLLLDQNMPKMQGTDVIAALRERAFTPAVFVLSGEQRLSGVPHGEAQFILKPFDADDLVARIRTALGD